MGNALDIAAGILLGFGIMGIIANPESLIIFFTSIGSYILETVLNPDQYIDRILTFQLITIIIGAILLFRLNTRLG